MAGLQPGGLLGGVSGRGVAGHSGRAHETGAPGK